LGPPCTVPYGPAQRGPLGSGEGDPVPDRVSRIDRPAISRTVRPIALSITGTTFPSRLYSSVYTYTDLYGYGSASPHAHPGRPRDTRRRRRPVLRPGHQCGGGGHRGRSGRHDQEDFVRSVRIESSSGRRVLERARPELPGLAGPVSGAAQRNGADPGGVRRARLVDGGQQPQGLPLRPRAQRGAGVSRAPRACRLPRPQGLGAGDARRHGPRGGGGVTGSSGRAAYILTVG